MRMTRAKRKKATTTNYNALLHRHFSQRKPFALSIVCYEERARDQYFFFISQSSLSLSLSRSSSSSLLMSFLLHLFHWLDMKCAICFCAFFRIQKNGMTVIIHRNDCVRMEFAHLNSILRLAVVFFSLERRGPFNLWEKIIIMYCKYIMHAGRIFPHI